MTEKVLKELKENFVKEKRNLEKMKELLELEKDRNVLRYMELMGIAPTRPHPWLKKEDDLLISVILDLQSKLHQEQNEDTYGIYVCVGTKNNNKLYRDLEKERSILITIDKVEDFENNHIIIDPNEIKIFKNDTPFDAYTVILKDFYNKCIKTNNEEAKKYILKEYSAKLPK